MVFRRIPWSLLIATSLLLGGFLLRMINLTNPPLDFHAARQLRGAIIARGMYYQMLEDIDPETKERAIQIWKGLEEYEPPVLERIVATLYFLAGGEYPWLGRLLNSLFWVFGGFALYCLVSRLTSPGASLFALSFYVFAPFGVTASRSFQPDPFMVMWLIWTVYSLYRWSEEQTWRWAILTAVFAGVAVLVKVFAAVILLPPLIGLVLETKGWRKIWKDKQIWIMALVCIAIPASYYLLRIGSRSMSFFAFWTTPYWYLIRTVRFYFAWLDTAGIAVGKGNVFLGLASVSILPHRGRRLALTLWLGYGLYGLLVPYQISTHDYYSLPLIPIVALSLASLWNFLFQTMMQQGLGWRLLFVAVVLSYLGYQVLQSRNALVSTDLRSEVIGWQKMGAAMPHDGAIIALTHDYGLRIAYYGLVKVTLWPYTSDLRLQAMRYGSGGSGQMSPEEFKVFFADKTKGYHYFLVTHFAELNGQPLLKSMLYENYPIVREGDGYILFDLTKPVLP